MQRSLFKHAHILIVDDQPSNVLLLQRLLQREGYDRLTTTTEPLQVVRLYLETQPDLILLDLLMPDLDGYAILEQLQTLASEEYLPVLVLTADISPTAKQRALSMGAMDFLNKPFDADEVLLRIRNLLMTRLLHLQLRDQNQTLEQRVREQTAHLQEAQLETLARLARAAEYRDDQTGLHTQRVGRMAALLAQAAGQSEDYVELIRRAAPLHDVGKIGIPDAILLKPAKLTAEEFERVKTHAQIGANILSGSSNRLLQLAEEIALSHHERWDGSGYPHGLEGNAIPLSGRIVAVADVFDALTDERPYKRAWTSQAAIAEIVRLSGRQFDPQIIAAFVQFMDKWERGDAGNQHD